MIEKAYASVERWKEEYKQFLIELASIEGISSDKASVDQVGNHVVKFAQQHGLTARINPFEKAGNGVVITLNPQAPHPPVALMGHMDTVFEKGRFGNPPVREKDGMLYGPGVFDMKGGIAIALLTMQALQDAGYRDRCIKLVLIGDEEISEELSGQDGIDFICNEIRGCCAAINCECHRPGQVTTGRKGSMRFRINVKGKSAHAGSNYNEGISAIKEAALKILAIEEGSDQNNITYNCGVIQGGTVPNIVPEECSFIVDARYRLAAQREIALKHINSVACKAYIEGTQTMVDIYAQRPTFEETPKNMMLFEHIRQVSLRHGFGEQRAVLGGGGSDSSYSSMIGVPSVCSMGITGERAHSTEEYALVSSIAEQAKFLSAIILDLPEDFNQ